MHVPVPAAADAGDAAQNPKTDEGDPLAGCQPWIFKSPPLRLAHASASQHHQLCSGPCSYCHVALHPCCLPRDSEEIKFNKYIGGFWCHCLCPYHLLETKKILGLSFEKLLEEVVGLWLLQGRGSGESFLMTGVSPCLEPSLAFPFYLPYLSRLYYLGPGTLFIFFFTYWTFSSTEVLDLMSALRKTWYSPHAAS